MWLPQTPCRTSTCRPRSRDMPPGRAPAPSGRLREQRPLSPAAPLDEQSGGVVAQRCFPAFDDRLAQSPQGFRRGEPVGGLTFDEIAEAFLGEELAVRAAR